MFGSFAGSWEGGFLAAVPAPKNFLRKLMNWRCGAQARRKADQILPPGLLSVLSLVIGVVPSTHDTSGREGEVRGQRSEVGSSVGGEPGDDVGEAGLADADAVADLGDGDIGGFAGL